jgi:hypothetical protein
LRYDGSKLTDLNADFATNALILINKRRAFSLFPIFSESGFRNPAYRRAINLKAHLAAHAGLGIDPKGWKPEALLRIFPPQ